MSNPHPNTDVLKPTQWKPGQSGNPGGRRKRVLSDRYQELMESPLPKEIATAMKLPVGSLWCDAIAHVSARTALKSTETGILQRKEIREAIEGKAVARVEFSSDEQIDIRVSFEDTRTLLSRKHAVLDAGSPDDSAIDVEASEPAELPDTADGELEKE
jgi:hypothetical protein